MTSTTIHVKYINPPAEGRKRGPVKPDDGSYYGVLPDMLGRFSPGRLYEIEYGEHVYQGKTYRTITGVRESRAAEEKTKPARSEAEIIFITGVVGRAMGSGKFAFDQVTMLALEAKKAWDVLQDQRQRDPD